MPVTKPPPQVNETPWQLDILQSQIESQHKDCRRNFYSNLLKLYAAVGHICSKHLLQNTDRTDKALQELSNQLSAKYGRIFESAQLKQMMLFAQQYQPYPSTQGRDLLYFNWEYLAVLLPLTDKHEQHFYMRCTATHQWSVAELQQHIADDDYHNPKISKALKVKVPSTRNHKNLLESQRLPWQLKKKFMSMPFLNPFVEPALSEYRLLLQPAAIQPALTYAEFREGLKADDLNSISLHIINFCEQIDRESNSSFNYFLWSIGDLLTLPVEYRDSLPEKLRHLYGNFFDAENIAAIKAYRNNIVDQDLKQRLSSILTWPHIVRLLYLSSEAQLFYAELTHEEDLSAAELQCRIESKWYEQTLAAVDKQKTPNYTTATKKMQRHEEVRGKSVFVIYTTCVDTNDIRCYHNNLNVLQNTYFMKFMATPLH